MARLPTVALLMHEHYLPLQFTIPYTIFAFKYNDNPLFDIKIIAQKKRIPSPVMA